MDSVTMLVSAISVAFCILPFALMIRNKKKRENELRNTLINISKQHNSTISQLELCGNFVIGLDDKKNQVFFFTKGESSNSAQVINLSEVSSCRIINSSRNINSKDGNYSIIEKLELLFVLKDSKKGTTTLAFFSRAESDRPSGELQSIEKWNKLINDILKK